MLSTVCARLADPETPEVLLSSSHLAAEELGLLQAHMAVLGLLCGF